MVTWRLSIVRLAIAVCSGAAVLCAPLPSHAGGGEQPPAPDLGSCRIKLPRDLTTIVYYTYGGSKPSRYRLFYERHTYLGRQPVVIPKRQFPIFVVLVSYGPTEWDLRIEPQAEVAGVLVLGYEDQIVSNIGATTPIGFSIFRGETGEDCPKSQTWWGDDSLMKVLRPMLDVEFSHWPDEYYNRGSEDCSYFLCERSGKVADPPKRSFWSSLFGGAGPDQPAPGTVVRTSARLVIR